MLKRNSKRGAALLFACDWAGHLQLNSTSQAKVGLAGATVLPGIEGFGASGYIRFDSNIEAVPRLPMAVEIVDTEAKIHQFLPQIEEMIDSGLVSLESVCAIHYCLPSAVVPAWQKHKPSARQC